MGCEETWNHSFCPPTTHTVCAPAIGCWVLRSMQGNALQRMQSLDVKAKVRGHHQILVPDLWVGIKGLWEDYDTTPNILASFQKTGCSTSTQPPHDVYHRPQFRTKPFFGRTDGKTKMCSLNKISEKTKNNSKHLYFSNVAALWIQWKHVFGDIKLDSLQPLTNLQSDLLMRDPMEDSDGFNN